MLQPILGGHEFIQQMPPQVANRLGAIAHVLKFAPRSVLFIEGVAHPHFHVIADGHVRLEMHVPRRGQVPILTAGRGDLICWSALIGDSIMTASGIALEPVTTIAFRGQELKQLCEAEHDVGYHVMQQLSAALSRRLLATRLQMLDLFGDHFLQSKPAGTTEPMDLEC